MSVFLTPFCLVQSVSPFFWVSGPVGSFCYWCCVFRAVVQVRCSDLCRALSSRSFVNSLMRRCWWAASKHNFWKSLGLLFRINFSASWILCGELDDVVEWVVQHS